MQTLKTNPYETLARERKALSLADFIEAHVADEHRELLPAYAAAAGVRQRNQIARLADVKKPSPATWSRLVAILSERAIVRRAAFDPFAGLTESDAVEVDRVKADRFRVMAGGAR